MKKELYRVGAVLLYAALLGLTAAKCHGQTRFDFTARHVVFHQDGATAEYSPGIRVFASGDTLAINLPGCPVMFTGVENWVWTDSGVTYVNYGNVHAKYTPGKWPELWLQSGALNITLHAQKPTTKL